jgi:hypothetical protein
MLTRVSNFSVIRFVDHCIEMVIRFVLPFLGIRKPVLPFVLPFFKNWVEKVAVGVGRITISITIYYYIYILTFSIQKVIQNILPFQLSENSVIRFVTRPYTCGITNRITIHSVKANQFEAI